MRDFDTIAALDLGSNSFHMVIAQVKGDELVVIDRIKEMVRLAAGLGADNNLDEASRQRALETLARFGERLRPLPHGSVRAVGTNTLRAARNGRKFLKRAEQALGHPVEIISGSEEARLVYLGVAHSVQHLWGQRLVIDIGGGSTEFIVGQEFQPFARESKYMGCVNFTQRFFGDGVITKRRFRAAEIAARQELQRSVQEFRDYGWDFAIGSSGTIKAIADIGVALELEKVEITLDSMKAIRKLAIAAGTIDNLKLPGLSERRTPVFVGGLAILMGAFKSLGIASMTPSDGALREGVLYDLLGRIHDHDVRQETIDQLATKYNVDRRHAERVEVAAIELLEQVRGKWGLEDELCDQMLRWAARIHEIGLAISHSRYHIHGSYLVENSDMPGFSRQDQKFLWALVRSHRRRLKLHRFDSLPEPFDEVGARLAVLLRVAVVLHRSRAPEDVPRCQLKPKGKSTLELRFEDGALKEYPLTLADLREEAQYLSEAGFKLKLR